MWQAAAAAALVEQHHPVPGRIEELPDVGGASAAWTSVHEHRRLTRRVAALFPVDLLTVADVEQAVRVRLDRRIPA